MNIKNVSSSYPIISSEEQLVLLKDWKENGNKESLDRLILSNIKIVSKEAHRLSTMNKESSYEDLLQEGIAGLLKATDMFDFENKNNYLTYAMHWVKAYMRRYVMDQKSMVRMGKNAEERAVFSSLARVEKEADKLGLEGKDREEKILSTLGVKKRTLDSMRSRMSFRDASLDAKVSDDSSTRISDLLEMPDELDFKSPLATAYMDNLNSILNSLIDRLPEKEKIVLQKRFFGSNSPSLREVGEELSMTKEGIRIVEKRALLKIKKILENRYNIKDAFVAI